MDVFRIFPGSCRGSAHPWSAGRGRGDIMDRGPGEAHVKWAFSQRTLQDADADPP